MTFQILTDTTCDLPFDYLKTHEVDYLGMTVTVDDCQYDTANDGELPPEKLLALLDEGKTATTSQINLTDFLTVFKKYAKKKITLLYLCFSSGLSGTFQSALMAKQMVLEEFPDAQIHVIDTLAAAAGEGLLVDLAVEMRDSGLTIEETITQIETVIPKVRSWVLADDLYHLMRGGRVSKTSAVLGSLANIKPVIYVTKEGKLEPIAKVRGQKKGLTYLFTETVKNLEQPEKQTIWIGHSGILDVAEAMKKRITESVSVKAVKIVPLGPTIAAHTGRGTLAIFSIGTDIRD